MKTVFACEKSTQNRHLTRALIYYDSFRGQHQSPVYKSIWQQGLPTGQKFSPLLGNYSHTAFAAFEGCNIYFVLFMLRFDRFPLYFPFLTLHIKFSPPPPPPTQFQPTPTRLFHPCHLLLVIIHGLLLSVLLPLPSSPLSYSLPSRPLLLLLLILLHFLLLFFLLSLLLLLLLLFSSSSVPSALPSPPASLPPLLPLSLSSLHIPSSLPPLLPSPPSPPLSPSSSLSPPSSLPFFFFFVMFYSSFCATYSNIVIVLIIN